MDAILASIKRIIAEEVEPPKPRVRRVAAPVEDVLELTEAVTDDAPVAPTETPRARLDALSDMVVAAQPPGSDTLEGLVREMLRPMLAEWLDAKLPAIVERQVAVEIERIVNRN